jgi:hypothetical protein
MKWEYRVEAFGTAYSRQELANDFTKLGAEGWELVAIYDDGVGAPRVIFKRPAE